MDHAAVVARLVGCDLRLLLEDAHTKARMPQQRLARDCQPENPGADDGEVGRVPVGGCAGPGGAVPSL